MVRLGRDAGVLVATIGASSMAFIDGSAVNVMLPVLQRELGTTAADMQWVVEAYALFLASLILLGGVLGDRYGRRRVFLLGLGLFTLASLGCAASATSDQLIATRALQGMGAALLVPGSLSLITSHFPAERRGAAIGTWAAFGGLTTVVGPLLGGVLAEHVSWRAVFLVNVPVAAVVLAATLRYVGESRDEERAPRLDVAGALAATLGLGALVFALVEGPERGWDTVLVRGMGGAGVVLLVAFVVIEARVRHPMMPLALFRHRTFAAANALTLFVYAALIGGTFFLSFNLLQVQGYSATATGAAIMPFLALLTLLSRPAGRLSDRVGARPLLLAGSAVTGGAFVLLALPGVGGPYWTTFFPGIAVLGLGMALVVSPLTNAVMGAVPVRRAGLASGVNNAVTRVAGLLAVAALGVAFTAAFGAGLGVELADTGLDGEERAALHDNRTAWGALGPPPGANATEALQVELAVDGAFVRAFRTVMLVSAALAGVGGTLAALFVEPVARPVSRR